MLGVYFHTCFFFIYFCSPPSSASPRKHINNLLLKWGIFPIQMHTETYAIRWLLMCTGNVCLCMSKLHKHKTTWYAPAFYCLQVISWWNSFLSAEVTRTLLNGCIIFHGVDAPEYVRPFLIASHSLFLGTHATVNYVLLLLFIGIDCRGGISR
jgi:hypothetical protein